MVEIRVDTQHDSKTGIKLKSGALALIGMQLFYGGSYLICLCLVFVCLLLKKQQKGAPLMKTWGPKVIDSFLNFSFDIWLDVAPKFCLSGLPTDGAKTTNKIKAGTFEF